MASPSSPKTAAAAVADSAENTAPGSKVHAGAVPVASERPAAPKTVRHEDG